jgi:dipeptidyl aminopeptidase/acylaminoacyl peptidase
MKCALLLALAWASSAAAVPLLPVETFFGTKFVRSAALSPDGTKIAFLAPSGDTYGLALLDLVTHKVTIPVHIEGESIQSFAWKGNDHIVFTGEIGGIEVPQIACTDLAGTKVFSLIEPQKTKLKGSIYSGQLLSMNREDPTHIIVEGFTTDSNYANADHTLQQQDVAAPLILKIDILTGRRTELFPASDGDLSNAYDDFGFDHQGQVRTAVRYHGDDAELLYRENSQGLWKPIRKFKAQSITMKVLGFTGDNRGVYVDDYENADAGSLRIYDPDTNTLSPALFTPEEGEIGVNYPPDPGLIYSPDRKRLMGVRYTTDRLHVKWFEPKYALLQARLEKSFPGHMVNISSMSDDENRFLLRTASDRDPGAYYLYDQAKGSLGLVTTVAPGIDPAKMAPMTPISFTARDGLLIHGYLTLPAGAAGGPLPFVLHPHGGPFGPRDNWGFDPEAQFLANRGYAMLQVNFRGSGGYGSKFLQAGYREWGGKMQDDLTDGVKWAIEKGYADPKRVAIFGASYGGYATLAGLVYTPELYKCGINYVGVSDLVEQTRRKYGEESPEELSFFKQCIGEDPQFLHDHSPVNFVERLRAPLLNAYGENDARVDIAQWVKLKAQLDRFHKDYAFVVARDEGHGFTHAADAKSWYSQVEEFLKKNL